MGHAALVLIRRGCAAGIFGDHQVKAQLPGVTGGGLHADVGGDTAQNNGVDPATAQLELRGRCRRMRPIDVWCTSISLSLFTERRPDMSTSFPAAPCAGAWASTGCFNASAKSADQPTRTIHDRRSRWHGIFLPGGRRGLTTSSAVCGPPAKGRMPSCKSITTRAVLLASKCKHRYSSSNGLSFAHLTTRWPGYRSDNYC